MIDMKRQKLVTLVLLMMLVSSAIRFEQKVFSFFQQNQPLAVSQVDQLRDVTRAWVAKGIWKLGDGLFELVAR